MKQQSTFHGKTPIMKKSLIITMFNKERSAKTLSDYKEQSNYGSNLLKESKTPHFNNLIVEDGKQQSLF